jgi:HPt (histidine-containing phosphotransfer) domain-containing protein
MNTPAPADTLDIAALNELKDMLGDALTEIAESFLEGLDGEVGAIQDALGTNGPAVRAAAHSLKGSAGNMGARGLAALAAQIEKAAVDGDLARCAALATGLPAVATQARQALQAYIAQP